MILPSGGSREGQEITSKPLRHNGRGDCVAGADAKKPSEPLARTDHGGSAQQPEFGDETVGWNSDVSRTGPQRIPGSIFMI